MSATSTRQVLLGVLITLATVHGQGELYCDVPGSCQINVDVGDSPADSYNDCLSFCQNTTNCNYFTYYPGPRACVAFSECSGINTDTCPDCLTGEKNCPALVCNQPGWCEGQLLNILGDIQDVDDCLLECNQVANCSWYNYNPQGPLCVLNSNCEYFDANSTDTLTGQRDCQVGGGEPPSPPGGNYSNLIFIAGGKGPGVERDVEIVNLGSNPPLPCSFKPAMLPTKLEGAVSTFMDGSVVICGGKEDPGDPVNACYRFNVVANRWDPALPLLDDRQFAASVYLTRSNSLWVTGGKSKDGALQTTEIYKTNEASQYSIPLPEPREEHTFTVASEQYLLVSGGKGPEPESGRKSWLFDGLAGSFTPLADTEVERKGEFAGRVVRPNGQIEVVVVGGDKERSSEIFNLESRSWRPGPILTRELWAGVSLEYGNSFIMVGGHTDGGESARIFRYNEEFDVIDTLAHPLGTARRDHTAVFVPDDFVTC